MKKNMNTAIIVLIAAGLIYLVLFHKPTKTTEAELKVWFSAKLSEIVNTLEKDIEQDNKGHYAHVQQNSLKKQGAIVYIVLNKKGKRVDVSDTN